MIMFVIIGSGLTPLMALITVLSHFITLYIFARIGIPVSSSQTIVGAALGVGLVKGVNMLDWDMARKILFGWIDTPSITLFIGIILNQIAFMLFYFILIY